MIWFFKRADGFHWMFFSDAVTCPRSCDGESYNPVCSTTDVTFNNECELRMAACKHPDQGIKVYYQGTCRNCESYVKILFSVPPTRRTSAINKKVEHLYPIKKVEYCVPLMCFYCLIMLYFHFRTPCFLDGAFSYQMFVRILTFLNCLFF